MQSHRTFLLEFYYDGAHDDLEFAVSIPRASVPDIVLDEPNHTKSREFLLTQVPQHVREVGPLMLVRPIYGCRVCD